MKKIAIIAALLLLGAAGQTLLALRRPVSSPLAAEGVMAALGGFRSLAAEAVWFRAEALQEEGRYVELAQLAKTLSLLEPHTPEVWSYAAWNLAYNISVMMPTLEDRWRWVHAGLRLLRDEGLRLNPDSAELHRELAWMFEVKIGADIDEAAPIYREKWREIVADVASRGAWGEIAMDPAGMEELAKLFGISDWTSPQASAIYWASRGLARSPSPSDAAFLRNILRHSLWILDTGVVHTPPQNHGASEGGV
ncbi:MAG: hypothetical protein J6U17_05640 [Kiritimatiellae bacterium]|nr:hypothetical protein [Kiritimatiellia bacterium]